MASWIDSATDEQLKTWIRQCPAMKLVTAPDGRILWANQSFLEWSRYRLSELTRLTLSEMNGGGDAAADAEEVSSLHGTTQATVQRKQLRPNSEAAQWGHLTRMRYPLTGDIECCLCTWETIKPATSEAFQLAMEHTQRVDARMTEMIAEIRKVTSHTDEENWVLSSFRIVQRHPRIAMMFVVVALSVMGLNNVVGLLQRIGVVELPVKIEKAKLNDELVYDIAFSDHQSNPDRTDDQHSAEAAGKRTITATTPGGTTVTFVRSDADSAGTTTDDSMRGQTSQSGRNRQRAGHLSIEIPAGDRGFDKLPGEQRSDGGVVF